MHKGATDSVELPLPDSRGGEGWGEGQSASMWDSAPHPPLPVEATPRRERRGAPAHGEREKTERAALLITLTRAI